MRSIVWGLQLLEINIFFELVLSNLWLNPTASAVAVASSNKEALAISMPVKSIIDCWKFKSISRRPCATSGW